MARTFAGIALSQNMNVGWAALEREAAGADEVDQGWLRRFKAHPEYRRIQADFALGLSDRGNSRILDRLRRLANEMRASQALGRITSGACRQ